MMAGRRPTRSDVQTLIEVTTPVFLTVAAGYLTVRTRLLSNADVDGLMKYAQGIAVPCLLFHSISQIDINAGFALGLLNAFYIGSVAAFLLGLFGARYLFGRNWEDAVVIGFTALFGNTVLMGLSIVERAYGQVSLDSTYAIVAFHAPFCYLLGISAMACVRNRNGGLAVGLSTVLHEMTRNPIVIGIALGFLFNFLDWRLPVMMDEAVSMVSRTALPVALFGLGGTISRYRAEGDLRLIAYVLFLSLFLHSAITLLVATRLHNLDSDLVRAAVITAAMAPGVNAYIFATMYDRAKRIAASAALVGTPVSILTASAWIALLG